MSPIDALDGVASSLTGALRRHPTRFGNFLARLLFGLIDRPFPILTGLVHLVERRHLSFRDKRKRVVVYAFVYRLHRAVQHTSASQKLYEEAPVIQVLKFHQKVRHDGGAVCGIHAIHVGIMLKS